MKTSLARFGVAFATVLSMIVSAAAAKDSATITSIVGTARYSTDGQNWQPLTKGMSVVAGTIIQTSAGSHVDVLLGEHLAAATSEPAIGSLVYFPGAGGGGGGEQSNVIRIMESTTLSIDRLMETQTGADVVTETQLDLRNGAVAFSVKKLAGASKFEIKYPRGMAGIRGTSGIIYSSGLIQVWLGVVVNTYRLPDGVTTKTQVVKGKEQFDIQTELITTLSDQARAMLPPLLSSIAHRWTTALPVTFLQGDTTLFHNSNFMPDRVFNDYPSSGGE